MTSDINEIRKLAEVNMAKELNREERALIKRAQELSNDDYEARRTLFKNKLYADRNNYHAARFVYSIGDNLVLDESDIIDFVTDIWGYHQG